MRCLTLADRLSEQGARCVFVTRKHPGNLAARIRNQGFEAIVLPYLDEPPDLAEENDLPAHASWLGTGWQADAAETLDAIAGRSVDWMVVDHYALDRAWETELRPACNRLMVIDDLADRRHECDLLLDQNPARRTSDYADLVPRNARLLLGSRYALLRREFEEHRAMALDRHGRAGPVEQILISMGGVDKENVGLEIIDALQSFEPRIECQVLVIAGDNAPGLARLLDAARNSPLRISVATNVTNMARLMAESDIAFGAAGGTSWERCCVGLPSIVTVLQDNQRRIADGLAAAGAALIYERQSGGNELSQSLAGLLNDSSLRRKMAESAAHLVDGRGATRVTQIMSGAASS
jgi:UDP-2,4-diacetamido-2,4,6-trideoxy-beta-L-altropyranose hydrolase